MSSIDRTTLWLAGRIHDLYRSRREQAFSQTQSRYANVIDVSQRLADILRRISLAHRNQLMLATQHLVLSADERFAELVDTVQETQRSNQIPVQAPTLRDVIDDLNQLEEEFGRWSYDRDKDTLSVHTDPITLEDVYLGAFEIQLSFAELVQERSRLPFEIIALDPHPASSSEDVTHPHVSSNQLCTGDATSAIFASIRAGRLCDLFLLVRGVLTTYNADSPYVRLDVWDSDNCSTCNDCGDSVHEDNSYYCERCGHDYCSDCISNCACCDTTACSGCLGECPECENRVCSRCLKRCACCNSMCCDSCLEDGLCATCKEEEKETDDEETTTTESGPANAAVTNQPAALPTA